MAAGKRGAFSNGSMKSGCRPNGAVRSHRDCLSRGSRPCGPEGVDPGVPSRHKRRQIRLRHCDATIPDGRAASALFDSCASAMGSSPRAIDDLARAFARISRRTAGRARRPPLFSIRTSRASTWAGALEVCRSPPARESERVPAAFAGACRALILPRRAGLSRPRRGGGGWGLSDHRGAGVRDPGYRHELQLHTKFLNEA